MNLALAELKYKNGEDFWSNIDHMENSYEKRSRQSQMKNENGSSRDIMLESKEQGSPLPSSSSADKLSTYPKVPDEPKGSEQGLPTFSYTMGEKVPKLKQSFKNDIEEGTHPSKVVSDTKDKSDVAKTYLNDPHPLLEVPPLYFILSKFPCLLENIKSFYKFRWYASYPLQKRVPGSNLLRKTGIHMTWGELLILMPFVGMLIFGTIYAFFFPSVGATGYFARLPLLFAVGTAVRNSVVTLLLGMPFERELWYHKLAGRIAFFNGILHTYVAYFKCYTNLRDFAFGNTVKTSGTIILMLMAGIFVTSLPYVRRKSFEVFYYVHVIFVAMMAACAFYHSGVVVPIVAGIFWGTDLFIRKVIMASARYPQKAKIRNISETVVEISFPKAKGFDYNPGQFVYIAIPELSIFEWHPFSLSSCPMQKTVTLQIRKVGTWTGALHDLAKKKQDIFILIEGPYGSPCVDITDNRYKSILLFSGGIGITPIQSVSNQLVYEYTKKERDLKRLTLVWIERDPVLMEDVDVVRHTSSRDLNVKAYDTQSLNSCDSSGIAPTLLTMFPVNNTTDDQLEIDYPSQEEDGDDFCFAGSVNSKEAATDGKSIADESTVIGKAYEDTELRSVLDLQVYLTSNDKNQEFLNLPFVRLGRPNVKEIFLRMREEALANNEKRVAVYVCAPARLAQLCRNACVKYSNESIQFDFHVEGPE